MTKRITYSWIYIILTLMENVLPGATSINNKCHETIQRSAIRRQYLRWVGHGVSDNDPSFFNSPEDLRFMDEIKEVERKQYEKNEQSFLFAGKRMCQAPVAGENNDLMERSTCPWYKELTFDRFRFPQILAKARCSCTKCYTLIGKLKRSRCLTITTVRKVLRMKMTVYSGYSEPYCENGVPVYINTWEEVPVGCTCVFSKRRNKSGRKMRV